MLSLSNSSDEPNAYFPVAQHVVTVKQVPLHLAMTHLSIETSEAAGVAQQCGM